MLFTTYAFVALVLATFVVYYLPTLLLKNKKHTCQIQVGILIVASLIFYAYNHLALLLLLLFSAATNAFISYFILTNHPHKRLFGLLGVSTNLCVLAAFKYSPLFGEALKHFGALSVAEFLIAIPLPIGISFYTFQGISLVLDSFKEDSKRLIFAQASAQSSAKFLKKIQKA